MLHISIFNIPDKHLISTCFSIILWGVYNPCMVLSMKVAHDLVFFRPHTPTFGAMTFISQGVVVYYQEGVGKFRPGVKVFFSSKIGGLASPPHSKRGLLCVSILIQS